MFLGKHMSQLHSTLFNSSYFQTTVALIFFVGMTILFTYPGIFTIDKNHILGNQGDPFSYLNGFWWYYKAIIELGISPFHTTYLFYPIGVDLIQLTQYNFLISVVLHPILDLVTIYNLLFLSNFVLSGFFAYRLSNYLTKNFIASLVAGTIFSFSSYHMLQSLGHLELSTLYWIPLFILYFIKTVNPSTSNIKTTILAGIFLFLNTITSWYLGIFLIITTLILIFYFIFSKRISNKVIFLRVLLIFLIFLSLSSPFISQLLNATHKNSALTASMSEQNWYSSDITNFFRPPPILTLNNMGLIHGSFSGNSFESITFLGFTALALSIVSIVKVNRDKILPWLIVGVCLAVVSLGPYLKVLGTNTNFILPDYFLFQLPFLHSLQVVTRSIVMVTMAVSVMAAFGIDFLMSKMKLSKSQRIIIPCILLTLVIIESLTIPYPSTALEVPKFYYQIGQITDKTAILETPIGHYSGSDMYSDYWFLYYQTIHQKPIYGGYSARVPLEAQNYTQTYFLNKFAFYDQQDDIVDQNLSNTGLSLLNYFNVGYIVVHKDTPFTESQKFLNEKFIPDINNTLYKIFKHPPNYEDDKIIAYVVPKSNSTTPFIILGDGWSHLYADNSRTLGHQGMIKIINPQNANVTERLEIILTSVQSDRDIKIISNQKEFSYHILPYQTTKIITNDIVFTPGKNLLYVTTNGYSLHTKPASDIFSYSDMTIVVKKIALVNDTKPEATIIGNNVNPYDLRPVLEYKLNDIYYDMLGRGLDSWGRTYFSTGIENNNQTLVWVKDVLADTEEHRSWISQLH